METKLEQKILEKLDKIEKEVEGIRVHMADIVLTPEEEKIHEQGLKEYREGKGTKLADLKKELGR